MKSILIAALMAGAWLSPALALSEAELVQRYCKGMIVEFSNPDDSRTDCISATHAIEVDFSSKWAEAIGQALHYSLWTKEFSEFPNDFARWHFQVKTPRRAGIIFACKADRTEACANHIVRPKRIAEAFGIPLTIWDCDPDTDATLDDCQRIDVNPLPGE